MARPGKFDIAALRLHAGDHDARERGLSICVHTSGFGTISSEISDCAARTFWYCYGWPCGDTALRDAERNPLQHRSWGVHVPFRLDALAAGEHTTVEGDVVDAG